MSNLAAGEPLKATREGSSTTMTDLATRSKDTQAAVLSLGMLNEGFRSRESEGREECVGGRGVEEEKSSLAPVTPQRAGSPNLGENRGIVIFFEVSVTQLLCLNKFCFQWLFVWTWE